MLRVPRRPWFAASAALLLVACSGEPPGPAPTSAVAPTAASSTAIPSAGDGPAPTQEPSADPSGPAPAPAAPSTADSAPGPATEAVDLAALQDVLDDAHAGLPSQDATVQAALRSPSRDLDWVGSSGPDAQGRTRPLRAASVGKTVTAATVLELAAQGEIGLDDPVRALLTVDTAELLSSDGYDLDAITPRQLLAHTSGLYDYAFGEGSPFLEQALADRGRRWTRHEQLELAVAVGDPLAAPGAAFAYSDTGYVVLGEIVEVVSGAPYHETAREVLGFERLGIEHLWLESFEEVPADLPPISRSFLIDQEITDLDFSLDAFGGGGYAGTTRDLARWFEALIGGPDGTGEVFDDPATLDVLLAVPATNTGLEEFGVRLGDGAHGVYRLDVAGRTCWSHRGFLGTIALTCPGDDVTVVVSTNTALTDPMPIAAALLELVPTPA
jgi:D-alanyl-D-alanine carboxypeptidase